jgi:hypothetical protein
LYQAAFARLDEREIEEEERDDKQDDKQNAWQLYAIRFLSCTSLSYGVLFNAIVNCDSNSIPVAGWKI